MMHSCTSSVQMLVIDAEELETEKQVVEPYLA